MTPGRGRGNIAVRGGRPGGRAGGSIRARSTGARPSGRHDRAIPAPSVITSNESVSRPAAARRLADPYLSPWAYLSNVIGGMIVHAVSSQHPHPDCSLVACTLRRRSYVYSKGKGYNILPLARATGNCEHVHHQVCRGDWISIPYPPYTHRKTCDNPHRIPIHTETPTFTNILCLFVSLEAFLNKHIYAAHVTVLLCVFSNDNEEKLPVKQITNWTVFGEIQPGTMTFIACLTRFRLISCPFKNLRRIPTGQWGFIAVPILIPYPYP